MVVIQENIKKANKDRLAKSLEEFVESNKELRFRRENSSSISLVVSLFREESSNTDCFFGVSVDQPMVIAMSEASFPYAKNCAEFLEKKGVASFYTSEALKDFYKLHSKDSENQFFLVKEYG
jgi:hypothetical protein